MQVIINSDNHVDLNRESIQQWKDEINSALKRYEKWVTRVEVHLADENSHAKGGGDDIRCLMEARPANLQPASIEVRAASVERAIREATSTMKRRLATILEKARTDSRKRQ
jgi:hypothetical protein